MIATKSLGKSRSFHSWLRPGPIMRSSRDGGKEPRRTFSQFVVIVAHRVHNPGIHALLAKKTSIMVCKSRPLARLKRLVGRHSVPLTGGPSLLAAICVLAISLGLGGYSQAGFVVGVDFVTKAKFNPLLSLAPINNLFPFLITGANSNFTAHGALAGVTEAEVQAAIVDTVQQAFRRAEINLPGRMLHVDIRHGAVPPEVGTVHLVGRTFEPSQLFGVAYPTGATFRPDLQKNSIYTNELSVTLADSIALIPDFDPSLRFESISQVVHAIAGTVSHEIGHTLNVWNHVPGGEPVRGWYPIMASGSTDLPLSARLQERRFLDIPDTQYQLPGPPAGGPLIYSVTETLLQAAGTTAISDFNFDGLVDGQDFHVWNTHKFQTGTGVKTGDANDDGVTDGSDFNIWNIQRMESLLAAATPDYPFPVLIQTTVPEPIAPGWLQALFVWCAAGIGRSIRRPNAFFGGNSRLRCAERPPDCKGNSGGSKFSKKMMAGTCNAEYPVISSGSTVGLVGLSEKATADPG
jgi:hypothetical protein